MKTPPLPIRAINEENPAAGSSGSNNRNISKQVTPVKNEEIIEVQQPARRRSRANDTATSGSSNTSLTRKRPGPENRRGNTELPTVKQEYNAGGMDIVRRTNPGIPHQKYPRQTHLATPGPSTSPTHPQNQEFHIRNEDIRPNIGPFPSSSKRPKYKEITTIILLSSSEDEVEEVPPPLRKRRKYVRSAGDHSPRSSLRVREGRLPVMHRRHPDTPLRGPGGER